VKDEVNETGIEGAAPGALAWFSYSSMAPAEPFNGNGTFVILRFRLKIPKMTRLRIINCILADNSPGPPDIRLNATIGECIIKPSGFPMPSFTHSPDIGAVGKPMLFEAQVTGNVSAIQWYYWDFGDGTSENVTEPTINHTYAEKGIYTVTLTVEDEYGNRGDYSADVQIVSKRDVETVNVYTGETPTKVRLYYKPNDTMIIGYHIVNNGEIKETLTLKFYYNSTPIQNNDVTTANWTEIPVSGDTTFELGAGNEKADYVIWEKVNVPKLDCYYYIMLNITGVPPEVEYDLGNNMKITMDPIYVTTKTVHNPVITDFKVYMKGKTKQFNLLLEGEEATFEIAIANQGNERDTLNVTLYVDGQQRNASRELDPGDSETVTFKLEVSTGLHNASVSVKAGNVIIKTEKSFFVAKKPNIVITHSPETPNPGDTVLFDVSKSQFDENVELTFIWTIYPPGASPEIPSSNKTVIETTSPLLNYTFNEAGRWIIRLVVKYTYGAASIKYEDEEKQITGAFMKQIEINVGGGGIPLTFIIGIILAVAVIIGGVIIIIKRKRSVSSEASV